MFTYAVNGNPGPAGRAMSLVCRCHMRTRLYWSLFIHVSLNMVLYRVAFGANGTENRLPQLKKWASQACMQRVVAEGTQGRGALVIFLSALSGSTHQYQEP